MINIMAFIQMTNPGPHMRGGLWNDNLLAMLRLVTSDGVQNVTGKSPLTKRSYNKAPPAFGMHYGCPISNTDLILNETGKKITE